MDLSKAVFGNIWNMLAYKVGAPDAEVLEKEYAPEFGQQDLVNLDNFKSIFKMSVNNQATKPFSLNVLIPYTTPLHTPEKLQVIKQISALKWWRKRELVEKEIYYRVGI